MTARNRSVPSPSDDGALVFVRFIADGPYDELDGKKLVVECDTLNGKLQRLNVRRHGPGLIESLQPSGYMVVPHLLVEALVAEQLTPEAFFSRGSKQSVCGDQLLHTSTLSP